MERKIIISTGILLVVLLSFVQAEVIDLSIGLNDVNVHSVKIVQYECEGCLKDEKCYSIGTRITSESNFKFKEGATKLELTDGSGCDLSWINKNPLYCRPEKTIFVSQKLTGESCENDFECESNKCFDKKCEQKNGMTITEKYNEKGILMRSLFFKEKEKFYLEGKNNNYSIGFGSNGSSFTFFINNQFYSYENKIFKLDENSNLILNSVSFENSVAYANATLIESENLIEDTEKLLEEINCEGLFIEEVCRKEGESFYKDNKEYKIENSSLLEISTENNFSSPITGNAIKENGQSLKEKILSKDFYIG